jgi:glycine cleavage system H protein
MVVILVLLTFVVFVVLNIIFVKNKKIADVALKTGVRNPQFTSPAVFNKKSLLHPDGYHFSKGHTWAKSIDNEKVKIGIDDFLVKALGSILIKKIVPVGTFVKRGDVIFEGVFDSKNVKFRSPVRGYVSEINSNLVDNKIKNPYESDWGIVINSSDKDSELTSLISGDKVINWMKDEFRRLKDFLASNSFKPELVGVTMYDGGNIVEGIVSSLDEMAMDEFDEKFLRQ